MKAVNIVDPIINRNLDGRALQVTNGSNPLITNLAATSVSTSTITFSTQFNEGTVLDRYVLMSLPITITFPSALTDGSDAFRALPLNSVIQSISLNINGSLLTTTPYQYLPFLQRFWDLEGDGLVSNMNDIYFDYSLGNAAINNPLGRIYNWLPGTPRPRGMYPITSYNSTTFVLTATLVEPLLFDFRTQKLDNLMGLRNVGSLTVEINFVPNLSLMWSHGGTAFASAPIVTFNNQATLQLRTVLDPLPIEPAYYVFPNWVTVSQQTGTVAPGNTGSVTLTTIVMNQIPNMVLLYVTEAFGSRTTATADFGFAITGISINFNNSTSILANANAIELYAISRKNGLKDTWAQFSGSVCNSYANGNDIATSGSFLALKFGSDIPMNADQFIGQRGTFNFSVTVTFRNQSLTYNPVYPTLYAQFQQIRAVNILNKTTLTVDDGYSVQPTGQQIPAEANPLDAMGGSLFGLLKSVGNKVLNSGILPAVVDNLGSLASSIGYGRKKRY